MSASEPLCALTSLAIANPERQRAAIQSWQAVGLTVHSFNAPSEISELTGIYEGVTFVPVDDTTEVLFGKAYVPIHAMCRWAAATARHVLILNSDIEIHITATVLERIRQTSAEGICYFLRYNYEADRQFSTPDSWGFDAFLFHGRHAGVVPDSFLSMGQPWWDYWLPLMFMKSGLPLWGVDYPAIFHRTHAQNWSWDNWHRCGLEFDRFVGRLGGDRSSGACHGMSSWARMEILQRKIPIVADEIR